MPYLQQQAKAVRKIHGGGYACRLLMEEAVIPVSYSKGWKLPEIRLFEKHLNKYDVIHLGYKDAALVVECIDKVHR